MTFDTADYVPEGPQPIVHEPDAAQPFPMRALGLLQAAAKAAHDLTQPPRRVGGTFGPSGRVSCRTGAL